MTGRLLFIGTAAIYDRLREKIISKQAESRLINRKWLFSYQPITKKKLLCGRFAPRSTPITATYA